MNLQFLQELENLSLDGEAFLAQFLEFLLDRSLAGDLRFDGLIPTVAQVLDLQLPITTVTSSFALLQAHIRQKNLTYDFNSQIKIPNSSSFTQNPTSASFIDNFPSPDLSSQTKIPAFAKNNSENPPNLVQKLVSNPKENLTQNTNFDQNQPNSNKIQTNNDSKPYFNSESNSLANLAFNPQAFNPKNNSETSKNPDPEIPKNTPENNFQTVSLSQVHVFLVRQIGASSEMSLKLCAGDLSIAKIDLELGTGILTLSSGALLNFLKTKKNLDWVADQLESEFGWKLHLKAQQRESKTILFENTEVLIVAKNTNYHQKKTENPPKILIQKLDSPNFELNSKENPESQSTNNLENQRPKIKESENFDQQTHNNLADNSSTEKSSESSVFYSLFWKDLKAPYNLDKVPIIQEIPEPPKLDWEDLIADFEME